MLDRCAKRYGCRPSDLIRGLSGPDVLALDLGCMEAGMAADQRVAEGLSMAFPVIIVAGG